MVPSIWSFVERAYSHFNENHSHLRVIKLRLEFTMAGVTKKSESFSLKKSTLATIVARAVMKKRAPVVAGNADAGVCWAVIVSERGAESALVSCGGTVCAHQRSVDATLKNAELGSHLKLTNDPLGST
jgi:hypothetical protein